MWPMFKMLGLGLIISIVKNCAALTSIGYEEKKIIVCLMWSSYRTLIVVMFVLLDTSMITICTAGDE